MEWVFGSDGLTVHSNMFLRKRTVPNLQPFLLIKPFHKGTVLNGTTATNTPLAFRERGCIVTLPRNCNGNVRRGRVSAVVLLSSMWSTVQYSTCTRG